MAWVGAAIGRHPTLPVGISASASPGEGAAEAVEVGFARRCTCAGSSSSSGSGASARPCSSTSARPCSSTSALRWAFCLWRTISPGSKMRVHGIGSRLVALAGVSATLEKCGVVCGLILLAGDLQQRQRKLYYSTEFVTEPDK